MIAAKIPFAFVKLHTKLSWSDVEFALKHQFITPEFAIDLAVSEICKSVDASSSVVELASLSGDDSVLDLVVRLSANENIAEDCIKAKWLYLVLAWVFHHRDSLDDPLGVVEKIYSDFDYPEELAPFVRYMPMLGPDLGSPKLNEARLFDYWEKYLKQTNP